MAHALSPVRGKTLILSVLQAAGGVPVDVQTLLRAAEALGISENATRVTLSRMVQDKTVVNDSRGRYQLGSRRAPVSKHVSMVGARSAAAWAGAWLVCVSPVLAGDRGGRRALWALGALGFRPTAQGFWVRPDNLHGSPRAVEADLRAFGAPPEIVLVRVSDPPPAWDAAWRMLWEPLELEAERDEMCARVEDAIRRLPTMPLEEALVLSFEVGRQAIAILAFDPLLPEELVPGRARAALARACARFEPIGRRIWTRFLMLDLVDTPEPFYAARERAPRSVRYG